MLVQAGLPVYLRSDLWQMFLETKTRTISGYYRHLVIHSLGPDAASGPEATAWSCRLDAASGPEAMAWSSRLTGPIKHTGRDRWTTGPVADPVPVGYPKPG